MNTEQLNILSETERYVKDQLLLAEKGHDWWHIARVRNNCRLIGEALECDMFIVEMAALMHDIADSKFHDGDESLAPKMCAEWLEKMKVDHASSEHILQIIQNISFKGGQRLSQSNSTEFQIVQDADRLDAIGAIGIARAFHYGGYKNRELYNPYFPPNLNMSREEYKKSIAPTFNHFHEKLLLLSERMNTPKGRELARARHALMEEFLRNFLLEWGNVR